MNNRTGSFALAAVFSLSALAAPALAATVQGTERKEFSGQGGAFSLGELPPGIYFLIIERSGYAPPRRFLSR
ncbi:MAG TPA: hypothetical protein V6C82_02765 [Chroococcales cyanobacterium]